MNQKGLTKTFLIVLNWNNHFVASELKHSICHSDECQIGSFSSEATIWSPWFIHKYFSVVCLTVTTRLSAATCCRLHVFWNQSLPGEHEILIRCWFFAGPASWTVDQHLNNIKVTFSHTRHTVLLRRWMTLIQHCNNVVSPVAGADPEGGGGRKRSPFCAKFFKNSLKLA